jgi:hypothetical protein
MVNWKEYHTWRSAYFSPIDSDCTKVGPMAAAQSMKNCPSPQCLERDSLTETSRRATRAADIYHGRHRPAPGVSHFRPANTGEKNNLCWRLPSLLDKPSELPTAASRRQRRERTRLSSYLFGARYSLTSNVRLIGNETPVKKLSTRGGSNFTLWNPVLGPALSKAASPHSGRPPPAAVTRHGNRTARDAGALILWWPCQSTSGTH